MSFMNVEVSYTRIVEHKYFEFGKGELWKMVITQENYLK